MKDIVILKNSININNIKFEKIKTWLKENNYEINKPNLNYNFKKKIINKKKIIYVNCSFKIKIKKTQNAIEDRVENHSLCLNGEAFGEFEYSNNENIDINKMKLDYLNIINDIYLHEEINYNSLTQKNVITAKYDDFKNYLLKLK